MPRADVIRRFFRSATRWQWMAALLLGGWAGLFQADSPRAWDASRIVALAAQHGDQAVASARALQVAMATVVAQDEANRVTAVNDFYNRRVLYREDLELWAQVDYWASPMETLQKGAGDCEDYAIAKYFTLVALGIPHRRLRMVYVRAQLSGTVMPHMVLAYYATADSDPLVLDSLVPELRPASRRPDLAPVFSFNAEGIWEGIVGASVRGNPAERMSRWGEVMRKARAEGFY